MAKKWYPEVWKPLEIELEIPKIYFQPSKSHSFYDSKADNEGYEVYGINPTSEKNLCKKRVLKGNNSEKL